MSVKAPNIRNNNKSLQNIKPDSLKRCATSILNKFSLSSIKPEQITRKQDCITLNKQPNENINISEIETKQKQSRPSIPSKSKSGNNNSNFSPSSLSSSFNNSPELERPSVTYKTKAENELEKTISSAHNKHPVTMLSELGQEAQTKQRILSSHLTSLNSWFELNQSTNSIANNESSVLDLGSHFIREKSTSTPTKSMTPFMRAIDKDSAGLTYSIEEQSPGLSYTHSNYTSDDEEVITPTAFILSDLETWPSTDEAVESSMKFITRYNKSNSIDLTPRVPVQRPKINFFYRQSTKKQSTLCFDNDKQQLANDSLDRSTSIKSSTSSSASSFTATTATLTTSKSIKAKANKKELAVSPTLPKFGKNDLKKKLIKANTVWRMNVEIQNKNYCKVPLTKDIKNKEAMARYIINELRDTEITFYQFLLFIRSNYMEPMQIESQKKNSLVKSNDVYVLFNPLSELIMTSENFLVRLEEVYQDTISHDMSPAMVIGRIFKELEHYFGAFLKYTVHYRAHFKAIRHASNTSYVLKIDRKAKSLKKEDNRRLGLADYLIAPFQRVPRYGLLIKDLLRHTDQPNDLIYAQKSITALAVTMNQVLEVKNSRYSSLFYPFQTQLRSSPTL